MLVVVTAPEVHVNTFWFWFFVLEQHALRHPWHVDETLIVKRAAVHEVVQQAARYAELREFHNQSLAPRRRVALATVPKDIQQTSKILF